MPSWRGAQFKKAQGQPYLLFVPLPHICTYVSQAGSSLAMS